MNADTMPLILRELTMLREQLDKSTAHLEAQIKDAARDASARMDRIDAHLEASDAEIRKINALHDKQAGAYGLAVAVIGLAGACGGAVVMLWKWVAARA